MIFIGVARNLEVELLTQEVYFVFVIETSILFLKQIFELKDFFLTPTKKVITK